MWVILPSQSCCQNDVSEHLQQVAFRVWAAGIGGSVVEYSPATRVARVRFPADAKNFSFLKSQRRTFSEFFHSLTSISFFFFFKAKFSYSFYKAKKKALKATVKSQIFLFLTLWLSGEKTDHDDWRQVRARAQCWYIKYRVLGASGKPRPEKSGPADEWLFLNANEFLYRSLWVLDFQVLLQLISDMSKILRAVRCFNLPFL